MKTTLDHKINEEKIKKLKTIFSVHEASKIARWSPETQTLYAFKPRSRLCLAGDLRCALDLLFRPVRTGRGGLAFSSPGLLWGLLGR